MLRVLPIIVVIFLLAGCGYRFTPGGEHLDRSLKKLFVDNFDNKTPEVYSEEELRNAFIDQLVKSGRFELAPARGQAQVVLTGSIEQLSAAALSVGAGGLAREERLAMVASFALVRTDNGKILWSIRDLAMNADYQAGLGVSADQANRIKARRKLCQDLSERAYGLMMSGF